MIHICERFFLKEGLEQQAAQIMQILDDLVGPAAHKHPGWRGHAVVLQAEAPSNEILMLYPWASKELHAELFEKEEPLLADFYRQYCAAPRHIAFYRMLAVDVSHNHIDDGLT